MSFLCTVVVNSNGKSIFRLWSTNTKTDLSLLNSLVCAMHYGPHSDFLKIFCETEIPVFLKSKKNKSYFIF